MIIVSKTTKDSLTSKHNDNFCSLIWILYILLQVRDN